MRDLDTPPPFEVLNPLKHEVNKESKFTPRREEIRTKRPKSKGVEMACRRIVFANFEAWDEGTWRGYVLWMDLTFETIVSILGELRATRNPPPNAVCVFIVPNENRLTSVRGCGVSVADANDADDITPVYDSAQSSKRIMSGWWEWTYLAMLSTPS